jgi:FkbM family methyltransferase
LQKITYRRGIRLNLNGIPIKIPGLYSKYFSGAYEQENFEFLKKKVKPGMVCLDIGSHLGVYAVCMAKLNAARVYCFEPTPTAYNMLLHTIEINNFQLVITAFPMAVSGRTGKNIFYLNQAHGSYHDKSRLAEANSLVNIAFGKNIKKQKLEVDTCSIDDFAEQYHLKIDFIKIDAEGAELDILKGAKRTLLKDRPSGIIGIHRYAYENEERMLLEIWDLLETSDLIPLFNNKEITKHQFLTTSDKGLLDIQFYPRS